MRYTAPFLSVITLGLAIVSSSTLALADSNAVRELATQNNGFGIDLYRELTSDSTENTLISPYSIFSALGMTYTGAQGVTASEMTKSLHFTQSFLETQRAFKSLNDELNVDKTEADYELIVANRLWGQQGMKWKSSFLNLTASIFGAGLQVEDFANTPEAACLNINNWVANKTNDRIKNIVPPNALTPLTKLVITNAIYFNGVWRTNL